MKRFALIGHPVAASQSPRLFTAAYDGRYPYDLVDEERFEDAWQRFLAGYEGINVTAPFKRDAFNRVDLLSERARRSGAVNLVVRTPEGLKGYNTDVAGVTEALRECGLPVSDALVIGTGGAARAAAVGAQELGCRVSLAGRSPEKGEALAREVVRLCEQPGNFSFSYPLDMSIEEKLDMICRRVYHADGVVLTPNAKKQVQQLTELGFGGLPICMAKTQYSFSDDAALLGAPKDFTVTVRNLKVSAGAGFIVALTGDIMTMPGLPKVPAAEKIDVDENGRITGLF